MLGTTIENKKQDRIHEPECRNGSYVKTATQLFSATLRYSSYATLSDATLLSATLATLRYCSYSTLSYSSYSTLL